MKFNFKLMMLVLTIICLPAKVFAFADWHESSIELVYGTEYAQFGNQADDTFGGPVTGSDGESTVTTMTIEYANGWKYGNTYLYFDTFYDHDVFNGSAGERSEVSVYSQGFEHISLNKLNGSDTFQLGDGTFVKDLRLSVGWQIFTLDDFQAGTSTEAACGAASFGKCVFEAHDTIDLFYGIDLELGNFGIDAIQFHGLTIGIYDDQNNETDFDNQWFASWYARTNWYWGNTRWQYDGFINIYSDRESDKGVLYRNNIFSQHQIKIDAGLLLFGRPNALFIGTEIQWSKNTFGVADEPFVSTSTDEFFPALLVEWVF